MFDSLGVEKQTVRNILAHLEGECDFNETAFQAKDSSACGEFCVYFAIIRYFNEDLDFAEVIKEHLTSNFNQNEEKVKVFLQHFKS